MGLKQLASFPPWQWPPEIGNTLLAVLHDRSADESDHSLAAGMAGEIAAINDNLAGELLSIAGDAAASDELRIRAVLALGPVLEQMDTDSIGDLPGVDEDSFDAPPIAEHTFRRIQQTLHARYLAGDIPTEVRRHILEASVRAPAHWHGDAVKAAYSSDDRDWRLTAVFAMRFVSGFDDEIIAALNDPDEKISSEAVWATVNWEIDAAWPHVALLTASDVGSPGPSPFTRREQRIGHLFPARLSARTRQQRTPRCRSPDPPTTPP